MRVKVVVTLGISSLIIAGSTLHAQQATTSAAMAPLTPELSAKLSLNVNRPVIVVMATRAGSGSATSDLSSVMSELQQVKATKIRSFKLVNAFAATMSDGEMARLKANPAVAKIIPDAVIRHTTQRSSTLATSSASPNAASSPPLNYIPGSCAPDGKVQLNPEALLTTNTDSENPKAKTARSLGVTGAGVKVAWIADGIDIKNPNFIRPNGTPVFVDYQDFSGDGPGQPTAGGEAFLDASSIAAQGDFVYNTVDYSAQKLPVACKIRIEGVAPGASLVGLDVFGTYEFAVTSNFLQAIDYAVFTDHVDVLNESFGGNGIPQTSIDVITQFDDAAVAAGTTVVVSSGDAGPTSTIGSPATDPNVIAAGASTTFRIYAQINQSGTRYFATTGWLDDNISALSSGGFTEAGRTVDLVAPGDLNWVSCTPSAEFAECTDLLGRPTRFADSGGTSESAPLTAGAAALVIEAYRNFHNEASPSPALVKQILTSSATDLGEPTSQQGSGILNTYNAVLIAESIKTSDGKPSPTGNGLLLSDSQLNAVKMPATPVSWSVKITNTGAATQSVKLAGRTLGVAENVQKGAVQLGDGVNPQFTDFTGGQRNYAKISFYVPAGADLLDASIAYPTSGGGSAQILLIDPRGRVAANSLAQGVGDFGGVGVRQPVSGTWTGIIFTRIQASHGINGTVPWQVATRRFVSFGSASPSTFTLDPGKSQAVQLSATTPASPGDTAGSFVVTASGDGIDPYVGVEHGSVAVTLRSKVDPANGGAFSGVLTGGNGRAGAPGKAAYYVFNVGEKATSITANLSLSNDFGDTVNAYLVDPHGDAIGFGQNSLNGINGPSLTANAVNPVSGVWTLVVDFANPIVGDEVSQAFTGNITLNKLSATASSLPDSTSTTLADGVAVTVPVTITNKGATPETVFIDARLDTPTSLVLASQEPPPTSQGYVLPLSGASPVWLVPSETSGVQVTAAATLPIEFDYGPFTGDPDLFGAPMSTDKAAGSYTLTSGMVEPGYWYANPDEIGPYKTAAPAGYVNASMTATTKAFDSEVTSPTDDFWLYAIGQSPNFSPITLNPGQTVVVDVTITPSGSTGTVVSGALYVDNYISSVTSGNELAALPYSYTIGAAPSATTSTAALTVK